MHRLYRLGIVALLTACGDQGSAPFSGTLDSDGGDGGAQDGDFVFDDDSASFGDGGASVPGEGSTCAASSLSATKGQVDIIFIVDTSGSMSEEIAQIKANINKF